MHTLIWLFYVKPAIPRVFVPRHCNPGARPVFVMKIKFGYLKFFQD